MKVFGKWNAPGNILLAVLFAYAPMSMAIVGSAAALSGTTSSYTIPDNSSNNYSVVTGPDSNLWLAQCNANAIDKYSPSGALLATYTPLTANSCPDGLVDGPDGNLWFTEYNGNKIGKITTSGVITEYNVPTASSDPNSIASGTNGNLWFTERGTNKIGKITTSGVITEYNVPTAGSQPFGITADTSGNLWFTELTGNKIGKITTSGVITEYSLTAGSTNPYQLALGFDGNIWFSETIGTSGGVGKITSSGSITDYNLGTLDPQYLTLGPDGNIWFGSGKYVGYVTTSGATNTMAFSSSSSSVTGITTGPDGNIWFVDFTNHLLYRLALQYPGNLPTGPATVTSGQTLTLNALSGVTNTPLASSVAIVKNPSHGTASASKAGVISYTSAANYIGADSLIYKVCSNDDPGLCSQATLKINVTAAAKAPNTGYGTPAKNGPIVKLIIIVSVVSTAIGLVLLYRHRKPSL